MQIKLTRGEVERALFLFVKGRHDCALRLSHVANIHVMQNGRIQFDAVFRDIDEPAPEAPTDE